MSGARILIAGGRGAFGSLLAESLRELAIGEPEPLGRERLDLDEPATFAAALEGAALAVDAAGPFRGRGSAFAAACLKRGVHYLDLSDDLEHIRAVRALARAGLDAALAPGWSSSCALSAALARAGAEGFDAVSSVRVFMAPGAGSARGAASVESLLRALGRPGAWSAPRAFDFPPPLGRRRAFLVESADAALLPPLFGGARVEFRVGSDLPALDAAAGALARLGLDLSGLSGLFHAGLSALGRLGSDAGGFAVELEGLAAGRPVRASASVVAAERGPRIALLPALATISSLLERPQRGLLPLDRWADRDSLSRHCARLGFTLCFERSDE